MPDEEVDGLDYFTKVNTQISRLDRTVITEVIIDEDKMADKIEERLKRSLNSRSTESRGVDLG